MDDLRVRFARIDRLEAPDLWSEAVERAARTDAVAAARPVPAVMSFLIAALLLALLVGVVAVGTVLRPQVEGEERLLVNTDCALLLVSPDEGSGRTVAGGPDTCIRGGANFRVDSGGGRLALITDCRTCFGFESSGDQWAVVVDMATGEVRQVDRCEPGTGRCLGEMSISPDGQRVAYARWNAASGIPELTFVNLESEERRTVPLAAVPYFPTWTPDSEAVIVSGGATGEESPGDEPLGRLYRVPFAGDPELIIEVADAGLSAVELSPDGRTIAFVAGLPTVLPDELRTVSIDGTGSATLLRGEIGSTFMGVAWSPDGERIAVTETPIEMMTEPLSVHVVEVEAGSQTTPYRTDGVCCRRFTTATWSPDGQSLRLVLRTDPDLNGTYAIPADGSGPAQLITEELALGWVAGP